MEGFQSGCSGCFLQATAGIASRLEVWASPKISHAFFTLCDNNGWKPLRRSLAMSRTFAHETSRRVRLIACLALLATLGACGSSQTHRSSAHYNPSRYYPPPGPASDPWGPYIHEASGRFGVPETWIRSVMRQEFGGQEDVISWAGAMGLMQVMPDTYDGLRARYNLGDDPFNPHNNILAGTAYLREMYDRFGSPGFLAAYNAGPNRLDQYLSNGAPLPTETVNYVASIAPLLETGTPMSGPLAVYAGGAEVTHAAYHPTSAGCDPDAAYDPDRPCTPLRPAMIQTAAAVPYAVPPTRAATPAPFTVASTPYSRKAVTSTLPTTRRGRANRRPGPPSSSNRSSHRREPRSSRNRSSRRSPRRPRGMLPRAARSRKGWPGRSPSLPCPRQAAG